MIFGIPNNGINIQVTDSTVDNIRPSLADFLLHPDLPSMHTKSTFSKAARPSRGETKRKGASHIFRNGPHYGRIFIENRYPHFLRPFVRLTCMPRPPYVIRDCVFSNNAAFQISERRDACEANEKTNS